MDTVPSLFDLTPTDYAALAPEADIIGGGNPGLPIVMNSGVMVVKNTDWARRFLARWWKLRCGFFDQYSLWKAFFETWAAEAPSFTYDGAIFETYAAARRGALDALLGGLDSLAPASSSFAWTCGGECRYVLLKTGCLLEPLQVLTKVLILPVVPFVVPRVSRKVGVLAWSP